MKFTSIFTTLFLKKYVRTALIICTSFCVGIVAFVVLSNVLISHDKQYILNRQNHAAIKSKHIHVGLVLGSLITRQNKPFHVLQARLDLAANALQNGDVDELLLSGDRHYPRYDEPTVMKKYLMETKHIPSSFLQPDYAGHNTYASCERASRVFGQTKVLIISTESHLPRAIYLCRHFGIEAYGIASNVEASNRGYREILARAKAVFNLYIIGQNSHLESPKRL